MIHGSGMPLRPSVRMIVAAARNTTRSRCGKGAPLAVISGTDSAVARVMEPRTAAQPTRKIRRGSGACSSSVHPHRK